MANGGGEALLAWSLMEDFFCGFPETFCICLENKGIFKNIL